MSATYCSICDKFFSTLQRKRTHDVSFHAGVSVAPTHLSDEELLAKFGTRSEVVSKTCQQCRKVYSSKSACERHSQCHRSKREVTNEVTIPNEVATEISEDTDQLKKMEKHRKHSSKNYLYKVVTYIFPPKVPKP